VARTLHKVTAFVTRLGADGRPDLLVMQHPTAGVQLPAGTVEEHEPVVEAAFRELAEETGLAAPRLVRHLGSETLPPSFGARAMLRTTALRKGPSADAPVLDAAFPRAYWCRVLAEVGAFSEIVYEELDLNRAPPRVLVRGQDAWLDGYYEALRSPRGEQNLSRRTVQSSKMALKRSRR
jgi:8-oxo-dGTP pyrophosphatase MutT (NUDIX family)